MKHKYTTKPQKEIKIRLSLEKHQQFKDLATKMGLIVSSCVKNMAFKGLDMELSNNQ